MWTDNQLQPWLRALSAGDVVAAPAEGVYGYCCDAFNPQALAKLMALKQRDPNKGVICLVPNKAALNQLVSSELTAHEQLQIEGAIAQHWPCEGTAPVTLILPAQDGLPPLLTGGVAQWQCAGPRAHTCSSICKPGLRRAVGLW
jgi:L-threonylcarbamoyladenylate synthase